MGAQGTRAARGTAAGVSAVGTSAGRGAGFRLRFGAAVGALALLSTGVILAVGGSRPSSAVSLSRGQLTLTLGGIFLAGVLSAALLAWALAGHRHATRRPGMEVQSGPVQAQRVPPAERPTGLGERRAARATRTRVRVAQVRSGRRTVAPPAPGTRAALRSNRGRQALR